MDIRLILTLNSVMLVLIAVCAIYFLVKWLKAEKKLLKYDDSEAYKWKENNDKENKENG